MSSDNLSALLLAMPGRRDVTRLAPITAASTHFVFSEGAFGFAAGAI